MFFRISNKAKEYSWPFSTVEKIGNLFVYLDRGWHRSGNIIYKGYCLAQPLKEKVANRDFSEEIGNYLLLDLSEECVIHHDDSRSFPLFYDHCTVTNLKEPGLTPVWFDGSVYVQDNQWHFRHRPENVVSYDAERKRIGRQGIVDLYCEYLVDCCDRLITDLPIFCADSHGADSLTIRSALDYCGKQYTMVNESKPTDPSLGWGYQQIYQTDVPHVQATGFCGDEMLLRNPLYCQWLLDSSQINLINEFDKTDHSYMKEFFNKNYRHKLERHTNKFTQIKQGIEHTANVVLNDFQMWHVDNTLTYTPYRNRNIAVAGLYADHDAILHQVIHAGISKEIILRLNPKNLHLLSKHKNSIAH